MIRRSQLLALEVPLLDIFNSKGSNSEKGEWEHRHTRLLFPQYTLMLYFQCPEVWLRIVFIWRSRTLWWGRGCSAGARAGPFQTWKKLLIYKCDIFRHNFRIRKYLPLTLILSHSPCCCYLCLHAVKTPTWKQAFWGRHDRVAHIGYGGIHCHLAARLRRRRVPQWRDGKLGLHLSSLRNTNFMPPPPLSSPHTSILLIYII